MPWLLEQIRYDADPLQYEQTYEEGIITVVKGKCYVHRHSSVEALKNAGYAVMAEVENEEDIMRLDPQHAVDLSRMGLGPLKKFNHEELDQMETAIQEGNVDAVNKLIEASDADAAAEPDYSPRGLTTAQALNAAGIG